MSSTDQALQAAVAAMNAGTNLFDVTIICCTDDHQADFWMDRLSSGLVHKRKDSNSNYPMVLAVSEDWNNSSGAGNGLGTLYAFSKAVKLAQQLYQVDLKTELSNGTISAALYHTAGKGTRLAPLPASENNNKPGVKLPFVLKMDDGTFQPLTVLEAVVKQTGIYASSRRGRLSVFWGDQVFLPSKPFEYKPTHHIDILCTLLGESAPTEQEWNEQGLEKYGVIACIETTEGRLDAAQVEKVSHSTATQMLASLGQIRQVGPSLGSFSVSAVILQALLEEFAPELDSKTAKLDTDPHFWMPLTLSVNDYVVLMKQKGTDEAESKQHHERMSQMKANLKNNMGDNMGLFGAVDVGKDACWWDYGQIKLYSKNSLLLLEKTPSADLLRQFLGVDSHLVDSQVNGAAVDDISYVFASKAASGSIQESILASVQASVINADGAIIVNCVAKKIKAGKGAILYNLIDDSPDGITAEPGEIMVAVTDEAGESMVLKSRMDIDGGKAWKIKLDMNDMSFEDVHKKNKDAKIQEIQKKRQENYDKVAASL